MNTPTLPTATEPLFTDWLQYAGDRALKLWVQERLAEPVEHVVYLRRLRSGALYVGITRVDRFKNRMRTHDRNAARAALPDAPNEFYSWFHGPGDVIDMRLVPDRIAALLLEAEATAKLAAVGLEVFGSCPAHPDVPWWERNWRNPSITAFDVQLLYSLREFVLTYARDDAVA
jgi:hypothetical protein